MRLVQVAGGLRGLVDRRAEQCREPPVGPACQVGRDDVRVQLRVERAGHPVPVRSGDQTLAREADVPLRTAAHEHGGALDPSDRCIHSRLVGGHHLAGDLFPSDREQYAHALRRRKRQIERSDLRVLPVTEPSGQVARVGAGDQRVELLRADPPLQTERSRAGAEPFSRRFAPPRVVVVAAVRDLLLVVALLPDDELPDREHQTALRIAGGPLRSPNLTEAGKAVPSGDGSSEADIAGHDDRSTGR